MITKVLEMDGNLTEDEIDVQLQLDAEQYIPYPLDEVAMDFEVQGASPSNQELKEVLLVACRNEDSEIRQDTLNEAGIEPKVLDVETYALERAFELIKDEVDKEDAVVAVFDIGSTMMTLQVLHQGKTLYTRDQLFGSKQLIESIQRKYGLTVDEAEMSKKRGGLPASYQEEVLNPFLSATSQQIMRSLQFFYSSNQTNTQVDFIVLSGGTASLAGLAEQTQTSLNIKTIIADPLKGMAHSSKLKQADIDQESPGFLIACGLALRSFDQ